MRKGFLLSALLTSMMVWGSVRANGPEDDLIEYDDCAASNWYVGFEAAILKPHVGSLAIGNPLNSVVPTYDYELSPRVWLGWENSEGIGVRARYWQIDADATEAASGIHSWVTADTLDFEGTLRGCLGRTDLLLSGGFRYAKLENGLAALGEDIAVAVEGCGLTLALEASRSIGTRGFALVGGFRQSWIYSDTDVTGSAVAFLPGGWARFEDDVLQISEANVGIQWSRCLANGSTMTAAALWEVQTWEPTGNLPLLGGVLGGVNSDIGFSGPTLSIALLR